LKVIDTPVGGSVPSGGATGAKSGGGFKKGGFKSSFAAVKGGPTAPVKKNVLGDDDDGDDEGDTTAKEQPSAPSKPVLEEVPQDAESDTDEEYARDQEGGGYYDPRRPTGCFEGCASLGIQAST
jgi:hypothetical protein